MASDITNGKGGVVSVTDTATKYTISPSYGEDGGQKSGSYVKVWNTGSSTLYAIVNSEASDFSVSTAIPIPVSGNFVFIKDPLKSLILGCATGETTTANYGAY